MAIFNRLFKQKTKNVFLLLTINLTVSLAISIFTILGLGFQSIYDFLPYVIASWLAYFTGFTPFFALLLFILTCFQNERLNRSQTWRLAPISDGNFYLDNIVSSFLSLIYFAILELAFGLVLFILSIALTSRFRIAFHKLWLKLQTGIHLYPQMIWYFIGVLIILILVCLFIYFLISFLDFSSQSIINFLPKTSNKFFLALTRFIIIILLSWALIKVNSFLINKVIPSLTTFMYNDYSVVTFPMIVMLIIDSILLGLNIFLINHFFEANEKGNN